MDYIKTEIFKYLIYLQKYLEGDLEKFKKLCEDAELEEKKENDKIMGIVSTHKTTSFPGSFEFIHGKSIMARSTIPHVLTLFSTIDILGFLLRESSKYYKTDKNFKSFFKDTHIPISQLEVKVLGDVFRNGIAHNYFPKLGMAISYHSSNIKNKIFFKQDDNLVLNVNYLVHLVKIRLDEIINDESLYKIMEKQYKLLINVYEKKCRQDIDELKSII